MSTQAADSAVLHSYRVRSRQAGVRDLHDMLCKAESSRVLNLSRIWEIWKDCDPYFEFPLFENRSLNRAVIVKQAVSPSENFHMRSGKTRATKLLFPLDRADYSLGGLYVFVGQRNFVSELSHHCAGGQPLSERDERVLHMLDELPTLDPFLLYALLKSSDIHVSEVYFQLSESDKVEIQREMVGEFTPLVTLCFPNRGADDGKIQAFIEKILNFAEGAELKALRESFKLGPEEFAMAMFAWRGIIYYKWRSRYLRGKLDEVIQRLSRIRISEQSGVSARLLQLSRTKIIRMANEAGDMVQKTVNRYDGVFENFVQGGQVERFRQFLKAAPSLFMNCGQSIAIMEHIMNFFDRKAASGKTSALDSSNFAKTLAELEVELGLDFRVKLRIW